jgi:hypothetical protein
MNAQVLLLTIVTGLFMAAWDGDQAAMKSAVARRAQQHGVPIAGIHNKLSSQNADENRMHSGISSGIEVQYHQHIRRSLANSSTRAQNSRAISVEHQIPLPEGIPAGEYHAVSQTGQSLRIHVQPQSHPVSARVGVARELYISDTTEGTRWFLVRIQSPGTL